jgi:SNF2 family DNA or RNA helicase
MYFKTNPFQHQRECLEEVGDKPFFAFLLEPGLGKSKVAIDLIANRKLKHGSYQTLVVAPNTLVDNWVDEIIKHSDLTYTSLTGTRKRRLDNLTQTKDIYIINYEGTRLLWRDLIDKRFSCLVLDESTCVKNVKAKQSKACYEIAKSVDHKYILTGTPIMNNPLDIYGQYRILNPNIFGTSFYHFKYRYAIWGGYNNYQVVKWVNMKEYKDLVGRYAIHRTKEQCLDLPAKLYQVVKLDLPDEQAKVYLSLKKGFIAEFRDAVVSAPVVLTRLIRFSQITAGFTKDVEGVEHAFEKNPKIEWLLDFIHNLGPDKKVVVFCRFTNEIRLLESALDGSGVEYVRVSGEVKDRIPRVKRFNTDPNIRVFIGQLQTTGVGINLTAASYVVFMTNSYSYGERVQAEDRCHRIGQSKNVTYIDLLYRNTVDISIHRTLRNKESLANMVTKDLVRMV